MIESVWPYLALMPLAAGLFPSLEKHYGWRVFEVLPPIVFTYLFVTALAVSGLWSPTPDIQSAQRALTTQLLPALLFLLMVTCDLRAILAVGPRVLAVFACAMGSILAAIVLVYLLFRSWLPADGWKMLAALSATWTGGSANLVAVKQVVGLSEAALPSVLLADALCYSVWVLVLFSTGAFAPAFNRWTRGGDRPYPQLAALPGLPSPLALSRQPGEGESAEAVLEGPSPLTLSRRPGEGESAETAFNGAHAGSILLWLGLAWLVGLGAAKLASFLPVSTMLTPTSWTVLIATVAGLILARTPLARIPGSATLGGALLALLVAVLASQSNFHGLATAPLFILCAACAMILHIALLALLAKLFRFDMYLCGISSLAQIGGVASAPVLAATYSPVLVPIAVLLAMLGLVLGTGIGLFMASVLSALAPA